MCRFLFYLGQPVILGDLITEPENSLIHQSFQSSEREEPLNGDGFGLAWYIPSISPYPGIFRSISPAWSNSNLKNLARITRSHCILAHVRAASEGLSVEEANCHPFVYQVFTFMHNGSLVGFGQQRRQLLALLSDNAYQMIAGNTDSEFIFAYFLDKWWQLSSIKDAAERLAQALTNTVHELTAFSQAHPVKNEQSYLNLVICDGKHAVISRYTTNELRFAESLHIHTGKIYTYTDGVSRMIEPKDKRHGAIIVSSERLSDDESWQTVPANHMIVIHDDRTVEIRPLPNHSQHHS